MAVLTLLCGCLTQAATINGISLSSTPGYYTTWTPPTQNPAYPYFPEPVGPTEFFLSDGTTAGTGAGTYYSGNLAIGPASVSGNTVSFTLTPQLSSVTGSPAYTAFAYSIGVYNSPSLTWMQAVLEFTSPLTLSATIGSNTASVSGLVQYVSADLYPADSGLPQGGLTAPLGSDLPFSLTFTLENSVWSANTFVTSFTYSTTGSIGTVPTAVPEPSAMWLLISGLFTVGLGDGVRRAMFSIWILRHSN